MVKKNEAKKVSVEKVHAIVSKSFRKRLAASELISDSWFSSIKNPNGKNTKMTVKDIWLAYKLDHLPTVTESSRVQKTYRCEKFLNLTLKSFLSSFVIRKKT